MGSYSSLVGKRIEVVYHFYSFDLFAGGVLLDDSDNRILIQQDSDLQGRIPAFELVIPYDWIIRLNEGNSCVAHQGSIG